MPDLSPNPAESVTSSPCWDPWILKDGETYRLFYLSGRTDQDPWWKTSWICESRSLDMLNWQPLGAVLEPLADRGWESGRLFAGSAYLAEGTYYLFYSAASESDISAEAIGLATSRDGLNWQRLKHPLLSRDNNCTLTTASGVGYAGRCNWSKHLHWRDPYVIQEAATQQYYLFFCASLKGGYRYQGGLGVAVANELSGPYELLPPVIGPGVESSVVTSDVSPNLPPQRADDQGTGSDANPDTSMNWPFYHLERPQIIYFRAQYHLFFSCFKAFVNPLWLDQVGRDRVTDSTLYWYVSDHITGPFQPSSALPIVPGSNETGLYGTTFTPLPAFENWAQVSAASESASKLEMTVLGWYHETYQLAIAQEFRGIWTTVGLEIVASS